MKATNIECYKFTTKIPNSAHLNALVHSYSDIYVYMFWFSCVCLVLCIYVLGSFFSFCRFLALLHIVLLFHICVRFQISFYDRSSCISDAFFERFECVDFYGHMPTKRSISVVFFLKLLLFENAVFRYTHQIPNSSQ